MALLEYPGNRNPVQVDEPGTVLFQSTLGRYEYLEPGYTETQLASYVFHWDRSAFRVPFMYKGMCCDIVHKVIEYKYEKLKRENKVGWKQSVGCIET